MSYSCSDNFDLVYVAHSFFIYSCQVYYGYKINDFLSLPPNEQTVERGFYLLDRWWYPTTTSIVEMSYNDISKLTLIIMLSKPKDLVINVCIFGR